VFAIEISFVFVQDSNDPLLRSEHEKKTISSDDEKGHICETYFLMDFAATPLQLQLYIDSDSANDIFSA